MAEKLPSEEVRAILLKVITNFEDEDRAVRDRQIRLWRQLKLYWDGFQRVWYSEVAHDWRIYQHDQDLENDYQSDYYDKPVNIFRAYLESIIAALSIRIPRPSCYPEDADNPLDISTAKAGNNIAELLFKHNDLSLVWLHALYIYCTEGLVFCYNYTDKNEEYGVVKRDNYKTVQEEHYICPECEAELDDFYTESDKESLNVNSCPECLADLEGIKEKITLDIPRFVGTTEEPKSRQKIETYGGLYVKVPNYAISQDQIPYLFFSQEVHYSFILEKWDHLSNIDWSRSFRGNIGGVYEPYERWGRLNPQYRGEYPLDVVTLRQCWLRPVSYNILTKDEADILTRKYPDGVKITLANEEICEAYEEKLDDHWTLTRNPLSDYLHHEPLGLLLTSIQDITNELVSLTLQTIEHGIPQTFADPQVINFDQYRQTEVLPGSMFPAKSAINKSLQDAFFQIKTSHLSGEVLPFGQEIQSLGQLTVGALPSLFGGVLPGSGQTAAEYSMSRAQALQRLQTPWTMFTVWWKIIFGKIIRAFIKDMIDDEQYVTKDKAGNFINVFIRKADVQGKIGSIELEVDENLPISWAQKKDAIMQLMQLQIPSVMEALTSPENLPFISEALGLNQFIIPGEADRQKQYEEINTLVNTIPIPSEETLETGEVIPIELPSVEIEPDVDNNTIHADICRIWLVSEAGRLTKEENPDGYKNVLLHMKAHMQVIMQNMMSSPDFGAAGGEETKSDGKASQPPVEGVSNVPGPIS